MHTLARLAILGLIINSLASCARGINSKPIISSSAETEGGTFAAEQSYRIELQGKIPWEQLENQTIAVAHDKQSKIATELATKIAEESKQAQQQLHDLLEKNKQLQRELRKKK
jgi:hypothetical protein